MTHGTLCTCMSTPAMQPSSDLALHSIPLFEWYRNQLKASKKKQFDRPNKMQDRQSLASHKVGSTSQPVHLSKFVRAILHGVFTPTPNVEQSGRIAGDEILTVTAPGLWVSRPAGSPEPPCIRGHSRTRRSPGRSS